MMLNQWNMEGPNLLISVTGGALESSMNSRLKDVFKNGLIKAAESTGILPSLHEYVNTSLSITVLW